MIDKLKEQGVSSYPHKFQMDMNLNEFKQKYESKIEKGSSLEEVVGLTGKVLILFLLFFCFCILINLNFYKR